MIVLMRISSYNYLTMNHVVTFFNIEKGRDNNNTDFLC